MKTPKIIGDGYDMSPDLMTSSAEQSIFNLPTSAIVYKLEFNNYQDCHIRIETAYGQTVTGFIRSGEGFSISLGDCPIKSLTIIEADIQYTYKAYYTNGSY